MRSTPILFVLTALALISGGDAAAQKDKDKPKALPPQNHLALDFADDPGKYNGKEVTFLAEVSRGTGPLREAAGEKGVPLDVYPPKGKGGKLLLGIDIPKGFLRHEIPNVKDGEEVIVTFRCTEGSRTTGNTLVAARRPD
ncbi:hypothetical protein J0H58_31725 [bacterium]|nr:hypothetical protein [bacterium]